MTTPTTPGPAPAPVPAPVPAPAPPPAGGRSRTPFAVALVVIIGILVALAVANGAFRGSGSGADGSPSASTPGVVPPDAGVVAEGRAVPLHRAELTPAVGGRVASVDVAEGDTVVAGTVLVQLDATVANADLDAAYAARRSAQASILGAEASVAQAQANVDAARASVEQAQASRRAADAVRDQLPSGASAAAERQANAEVDAATAAVDVARAQLAGARAALRGAGASLEAAKEDEARAVGAVTSAVVARDQHTITAPITGTVVSLMPAVGDLVQPGQVVVRLGDLQSWRFEATDLSETSISRVTAGAPATVTVDGLPGEEIAGTVESVGGYGTESQGDIVFRVVVAPSGAVPDGLRWNMTVTMEVATSGS